MHAPHCRGGKFLFYFLLRSPLFTPPHTHSSWFLVFIYFIFFRARLQGICALPRATSTAMRARRGWLYSRHVAEEGRFTRSMRNAFRSTWSAPLNKKTSPSPSSCRKPEFKESSSALSHIHIILHHTHTLWGVSSFSQPPNPTFLSLIPDSADACLQIGLFLPKTADKSSPDSTLLFPSN